jgi:choline dehydrogenase
MSTIHKTIVVGSGSSGGVIAARLSEDPSQQVTLIEAGPGFLTTSELPQELRDPEGPALETPYDWDYKSFWTEPAQTSVVGDYPRGRVLGGSSSTNASMAIRGLPRDYDEWAALGNPGWEWESVLPYFNKLESDQDYGDESYHGTSGPIPVRRPPVEEWPTAVQSVVEALEDHDLTYVPDFNEPGVSGISPTPRNKIDSVRASSAVTYLNAASTRDNLDIEANALATRVLFDGTTAVGVEFERDGKLESVHADRVILSGGAINTPQLLMLSGIGPKEQLERVGIDVLVDSPGVGANLIDHPHVPVVYAATDPTETRYGFNASLRWSSGVAGGAEADMVLALGFTAAKNMNFELAPDVKAGVFLPVILAKPEATGWLELTSADPHDKPELHLNFLDSEADRQRLANGVKFAIDLLHSAPVAEHVGAALLAPDDDTLADQEKLDGWIRENVTTTYHCVGTCRMGPESDELAVLDSDLRVRGVDNLYVADASIMPTIVTAYTNLTCYMIGEKFADTLKEESK